MIQNAPERSSGFSSVEPLGKPVLGYLNSLLFGKVWSNVLQENMIQMYETIAHKWPAIKSGLTICERKYLFDRLYSHRVARLEEVQKYDPGKLIGFCYGRAMAGHLIARGMGLKPDSIRKLFMVGELRSLEETWIFHVTTLVKATEEDKWYAIDPRTATYANVMDSVPVEYWIECMQQKKDQSKQARFFLTTPDAIMPYVPIIYLDRLLETGETITELNFAPEKHEAIADAGWQMGRVYEVGEKAAQRFFVLSSAGLRHSFNFVNADVYLRTLTTNEKVALPYNNYFLDLLTDLIGSVKPDA